MLKAKLLRLAGLRFLLIAMVLIVPVAFVLWVTQAASRTWSGGTLGDPTCLVVNNFWNNQCNWTGKILPVAGDDLTFPSSTQPSSFNNFSNGTTFNSISISGGHSMQGNSVSLNAGITATNSTIVLSSIKLNNNQTFNAPAVGVGATIVSPIDNNGKTLTVDGPGVFTIIGIISGAGGLTKIGTGTTQLVGANSYLGITSVKQGTLLVLGSQPNSNVFAGDEINPFLDDRTLGGVGTVGSVTLVKGGKISPGGANNGTGILSVNGNVSSVSLNTSLDVDLNGTTVGSGYDQLKVNGSVSLGSNTTLNVSLGSIPPAGATFLIVDNDGNSDAVTSTFLGRPEGSSFTINNTTFFITYKGGDGNDVVLHVPQTKEWTGSGANALWTTGANWLGGAAPQLGDILFFPGGAARLTNTNDFPAGMVFSQIALSGSGYHLGGNDLTLTNGITDSAGPQTNSTIGFASIKLSANQIITKLNTFFMNIDAAIDTNGKTLTLDGSAQKNFSGPITGSGGLVINGSGDVQLPGGTALPPHTFTGPTIINSGSFTVFRDTPNSPIQLKGGVLSGNKTINSIAATGGTIQQDSELGAPLVTTGDVTLSSAVNFAVGLVRSATGLTNGSLTVGGALNLGGSSLIVSGGFVTTPTPGDTFMIINKTSAGAIQGTFNGFPEGSPQTIGGVTFRISYAGGDGNDVVLSVPPPTKRTWDGGSAVNSNWQTKENWANDVAPLSGDDLEFPAGAMRLTNVNDFPAGTTFTSISITGGGYNISGNGVALNAGIVSTSGTTTTFGFPISLNSDQSFTATNNLTLMLFASTIDNKGHLLTLNGTGGHIFGGIISGAGGLIKTGVLSSDLAGNNTYTGLTTILGSLRIDGNQPGSAIQLTSGLLFGRGTVGPVTAIGGALSPIGSSSPTAILNVVGNTSLSLPAILRIQLQGTSPGAGYDQLNVTGTVNLDGAALDLSLLNGFSPAVGDTFIIVNNDLADPVNGIFAGLPEGSILIANGSQFRISYTGGNGNDVVITAIANATSIIQFSAASYSVNENAGFATITLTRSGDSSGAATVDFETADISAEQRTDYTIGAGTVTFAPGETSKTFAVLIVDDLYVEDNEPLYLTLSNPTGGAALLIPNVRTLTILDDDPGSPTTNPLDTASFFVRQHYYDFLSRFPDTGGGNFWTGVITQCGVDPICIRNKRVDVSNAFFYELEYQQTGAYTFRLYRAAFGNHQPFPNPDGSNPTEANKLPAYDVFARDRARVVGGADLASGQLSLANAFVLRPDFLTRYPASLDGAAFVDAILATIRTELGVELSLQRTALINLHNSNGRGAVLYRLADDNAQTNPINNRALIDGEYNRAFVATQYFGYLRRDADIGGFLFWLGQVNGSPLRDVTRQHAMVCSFITSLEYQFRFSPVSTHSNGECSP